MKGLLMFKRAFYYLSTLLLTIRSSVLHAQETNEETSVLTPPEPINLAEAPAQTLELLAKVKEILVLYGMNLIAAIVIFIVGKWAANLIRKLIARGMRRGSVDETLVKFVSKLTYFILLAFVIIAAINRAGIQTTSLIAVLGAAGLAIGLALQGSLSNFASGVMLIIFRPFKVGDTINAAGELGTVEEISIFTTVLKTPDNKRIIVPNSGIYGGNITNFSANATRRVEVIAGIGYDDDIDKAKDVLMSIIKSDERILPDPEPALAVTALADSSVNISVRVWVNTPDFWGVTTMLNEQIKKKFDENGISIPFPQRDVHLHQAN